MLRKLYFSIFSFAFVCHSYEPTWESLDTRPLPQWYDDAKIGIFLHWGVFSVLPFSEWVWYYWGGKDKNVLDYLQRYYPADFSYADLASSFKADLYNSDQLADIFKASGANYVVLTSKHHEGYTMWPSKFSWNWNSMDVGPKRDLVGELASSIRNRTKLRFGLYHSLFEWYHPLYIQDQKNGFKTKIFPMMKTLPELYEIVMRYEPEIIWSDGDWDAPYTYWNSTDFIAWLYNQSPVKDTVVVNDRWGAGIMCHHGDFYTCNDRYNPGVLVTHKWENCLTLDYSSWGYRRTAGLKDIMSIHELITQIASTVSCGGNVLINAGIRSDGRLDPIFEERLAQMGEWLKVNGEAIYESKAWKFQNDTLTKNIWYTKKDSQEGTIVYATVLEWPTQNILRLACPQATPHTRVQMLGWNHDLVWEKLAAGKGITVIFPYISPTEMPSQVAWVLKFINLN